MGFFDGVGTLIGAMSKTHTNEYIIVDRNNEQHRVEAISPENAVQEAIHLGYKIDVKQLQMKKVR